MFRLTPGMKWLMIVHAAVWAITRPFFQQYMEWTTMVPSEVLNLQVWRLFTYPFVTGMWDLLWIAISFIFFGPQVEEFLGTRRFVAMMLTVPAVAGVFLTGVSLFTHAGAMAGPTAMDLALLAVFVRINPNQTIRWNMLIPIKAIHMLWIVVALRVFSMWEAQMFLWTVVAELVALAFAYFGVDIYRGRFSLADINPVEHYKNWQYRRKMMKFKVHSGGKKADPTQYLH